MRHFHHYTLFQTVQNAILKSTGKVISHFCLWIPSKFFHWEFYEKRNVPVNHFSFIKLALSHEKLFKWFLFCQLQLLWLVEKKLWEFLGDNCFNRSASQLIIMSSLSGGKSLLTWGVTGNSQVLCAFEKSSCLIEFLNIGFFFSPSASRTGSRIILNYIIW